MHMPSPGVEGRPLHCMCISTHSIALLCRYLVPADLSVGQFVYVIRRRIQLPSEKAIFIFVRNILPPIGTSPARLQAPLLRHGNFALCVPPHRIVHATQPRTRRSSLHSNVWARPLHVKAKQLATFADAACSCHDGDGVRGSQGRGRLPLHHILWRKHLWWPRAGALP